MDVLVIDYGAGNLTSVMKALRAAGASPSTGAGAGAIARARAIVIPGVGHFSQTASIDAGARDAIRAAIARGVPVLGICLGLQWLFEGSDEAPDVAGLGVFAARCFRLGSDQGQTRVRPGSDRGQTRVRPGSDRASTKLLRGSDQCQTTEAPVSRANRIRATADCRLTPVELSSDPVLTLVEVRSDPGLTLVEVRSDPSLTPVKVPHVGWNTIDAVGQPRRLLEGVAPSAFAYFTHTYAAPVVADTVATTTHGAVFSSAVEQGPIYGAQFHPEKSGDAGLRLLTNFVRIAAETR